MNYRTPDLVANCLAALLPELGQDAAVVVVDNASGDNSLEHLRGWLGENDDRGLVRLVASKANTGFSGGNNIGIREISAEHYLLLNSDAIVRPGAIARLLATADEFPQAGIISPRLEWPDGTAQESCFRDHTPISEFISAVRIGLVASMLRRHVVPLPVSEERAQVEWTSFACVLLRHAMVQQIGLMDEGFFMYFEDAEYGHRARSAGWSLLYEPDARVVHLRGGSAPVKRLGATAKRLPRYYYSSRARYFGLVHGRAGLLLANTCWTVGRCISKTREVLTGRPRYVPACQWRDIWTNWADPLRTDDVRDEVDS